MSDILTNYIDREKILKKLKRWRLIALILISIFIIKSIATSSKLMQQDYIAQITLQGFIADNQKSLTHIERILRDSKAKALIVNINSPGGSFVGGEQLYNVLRKFNKKQKPVVALIGSQATSAAYLAALGADHIIAYKGSLTGSIGVLLQSFEISDLSAKLGITPIILKSSPLKATPHPAEKLTDSGKHYLQDIVNQSQEIFLDIITERRPNITKNQLSDIKLGKIYTGLEAKNINLIDAVGDMDDAKKWLKNQNININSIINIDIYDSESPLSGILKGFNINNLAGYRLLSIL